MTISVSPSESDLETALTGFLSSDAVLPGVEIVQMQTSRVPEPQAGDFVAMNPVSRPRLSLSNDVSYSDIVLTGSINAEVLTVTAVEGGLLGAGLPLQGADVAAGTTLGAQLTGGAGGPGTYGVVPSQMLGSQQLTAGTSESTQWTEVIMQLDVHGDASSDNVQIVSTMFRDQYAVDFFADTGLDITPLFADEPRQLPFINAEQAWETRWSIDLHFQVNATVLNIPQQFADQLNADLIDVA